MCWRPSTPAVSCVAFFPYLSVALYSVRLLRLCGGLCPGLLDFHDFLGCCWSGGCWHKSGGDDLAPELGEHVEGGGFGLGPEPGGAGAALGWVVLFVAVQGVPDDEDAVAEQSERDGPFHGLGDAVACLPGTKDVLDIKEHHFNGPAGGVAGDDLLRCGGGISSEQRAVLPLRGGG